MRRFPTNSVLHHLKLKEAKHDTHLYHTSWFDLVMTLNLYVNKRPWQAETGVRLQVVCPKKQKGRCGAIGEEGDGKDQGWKGGTKRSKSDDQEQGWEADGEEGQVCGGRRQADQRYWQHLITTEEEKGRLCVRHPQPVITRG